MSEIRNKMGQLREVLKADPAQFGGIMREWYRKLRDKRSFEGRCFEE